VSVFGKLFAVWLLSGLVEGLGAQSAADAQHFMHAAHQGMNKMNLSMQDLPMDLDVDREFAIMMLPHHEAALDMAKAELLYGKDEQMRRLAQEILADQQSEIDLMNLWLSRNQQRVGQ
jgi:uncharacterized protein (DUF305 family)